MTQGSRFSDILPRTAAGLLRNSLSSFTFEGSTSIDYATITQVAPNNSFRLGQQIMFWIGLYNPQVFLQDLNGDPIPGTENWVTRIRLKPWWARPNFEHRQAYGGSGKVGSDTVFPIDRQNFEGAALANNRYVWIPSPKRLDITPYDTAPPPVSPVRNSDSEMLDECWAWDLDDPTDASYQAAFPGPFVPSRWSVFFQPAMGYSLGLTAEATYAFTPQPNVRATPFVGVSITWATGTLGGTNYQESVG
jgi:hypothetical protein